MKYQSSIRKTELLADHEGLLQVYCSNCAQSLSLQRCAKLAALRLAGRKFDRVQP